MSDIKRNLEHKINYLLAHFAAVVILGARQTGKTTLATMLRPDWRYIDLEKPSDFDMVSFDPQFFFERHQGDLILDEAQYYPSIFSVLRGVIDANRQRNGRYLITGSSSPDLLKHVSETLAGRVAIVELSTLKANEFNLQPLSRFYQLFNTTLNKDNLVCGPAPLSNEQMQQVWLRGGYPQAVLHTDEHYYWQWMEQYRNTYINRDLAHLFPRLNKVNFQRFLMILSKLSGTIINKSNVARSLEVSEGTIREYINIAEGTYLWRSLLSYENNILKAVVKMPKGYIRDSGLLHYLLKIHTLNALYEDPSVGISFEAFVIEEIIKGLQATLITNWQPYYYRTRNGAEIDLILEGPFGILPIEIKYGSTIVRRQLTSLSQFVDEHHLPFGMVINQSEQVTWLTDKIIQIPVGWL